MLKDSADMESDLVKFSKIAFFKQFIQICYQSDNIYIKLHQQLRTDNVQYTEIN